jgi:light-regulated signal transduction histidine kinase (bacteriophytochrome)
MEKEIAKSYSEALSFFGKTNRLISHELKNILAIISETLGLIDELMELAETGRQLEPGKLRSLSESVIEEIERANTIIRNMNTFAHSVDDLMTEVDVGQAVALVVALSQLDSISKQTKPELLNSEPCVIYTIPIFLKNLIYHVLNFALRGAETGQTIRISYASHEREVKIIFSGIASNVIGEFPTMKENLLASILSAEVFRDTIADELHIVLPKRIDEAGLQSLLSDL